MSRLKITRLIAFIVTAGGLAVMMGWIWDIPLLKSIHPAWVAMKFPTACCFSISGIMLGAIVSSLERSSAWSEIVLPITTMIILLIMGLFFVSTFIGIRTGIEELFLKEPEVLLGTLVPGRPSVGTMVGFIIVSVAGLLTLIRPVTLPALLLGIGWVLTAMGTIAVLGYVFTLPILYCAYEGVSMAMAFHTAILFFFLGAGLVLLGRKKIEREGSDVDPK